VAKGNSHFPDVVSHSSPESCIAQECEYSDKYFFTSVLRSYSCSCSNNLFHVEPRDGNNYTVSWLQNCDLDSLYPESLKANYASGPQLIADVFSTPFSSSSSLLSSLLLIFVTPSYVRLVTSLERQCCYYCKQSSLESRVIPSKNSHKVTATH